MLVRLLVKNFGIIEEIDWSLGPGLNMLTGETGAGKSLVVDAISALLSCKLDESSIRQGTADTKIEAIFDLSSRGDIQEFLHGKDIETEEDTLIFTLTQKRGGRAVIRLNGSGVSRSLATDVGRRLIDIHSQSQHLSLLDPSRHLDFVDSYAGTLNLRHEFGKLTKILSGLTGKITEISAEETDSARRRDFLLFQLQEIEKAALVEDEDVRLEDERKLLAAAEKLKLLATEAAEALDGNDVESPASNRLAQATADLEKLSNLDDRLKFQTQVVRDAMFGVTEAARDIRNYAARINADPNRLEEIENRISSIRDLKRKYGKGIPEILAFAEKTRHDLNQIDNLNDRKRAILREIDINKQNLALRAEALTGKRQAASIQLEQAVNSELIELGMERAQFRVSITEKESRDGLSLSNGHFVGYDLTGSDTVEFLISTNPGELFQSIEKIASTGELSRFTLAVKTSLASADKVPVLIFDEIDIGVGGRSGDVIGRKLTKISLSHQVICISHLPQIACYGSHHFNVRKIFDGERAKSIIAEVSEGELVTELACMLSGQDSRASADSARELLANASSVSLLPEETH